MSEYINCNGEYCRAEENAISVYNRAFKYGDALFETMFASGSEIPLYNEHIKRLVKSMMVLKMEIPVKLSLEAKVLQQEITRLLTKNKFFTSSKVRLTVFRQDGGNYVPTTNNVSYIVETEKLAIANFEVLKSGLKIDVFTEIKKPINIFANMKTANSLLYVMAGIYQQKKNLDEVIILNQNNNICESVTSNVFVVKADKIYTPALSEGCIEGVMRQAILQLAKENNMEIIENTLLTTDNLLQADEIFLTNAVQGIRWVAAFQNRRYFNKISKYLTFLLNNKYLNI